MNRGFFGKGWLAGGYIFLYLPIVSLVLYSFNDSPIPNRWSGFTFGWYAKLARDAEMLSGLWLSLKIAFCSAPALSRASSACLRAVLSVPMSR